MSNLTKTYQSILHLGLSGYPEIAPVAVREMFSAHSGWRRLFNILARLLTLLPKGLYYHFKYKKHRNYERLKDKPWLFILSKNNRDVLSILKQHLPESADLVHEPAIAKAEDIAPLLYLRTFLNLYRFPAICWGLYRIHGKLVWSHIDYIFKAAGQYEASRFFIKKHRPKYIVFSNDHSPLPRAMLLAAKSLNVPTIYVQHASVTPYFPALIFDLNLLEGQDSLDKYAANGEVTGEVQLIGMPKFDQYTDCRNTSEQVRRVGICCNKMDKQQDLEKLMQNLAENLPNLQFTFRPHPADERVFHLPKGILYSDGKKEPVFDFLQQQDLIIAGNTSTHLEATLLNVVSIYYEFSPYPAGVSDMYGYYKNGMVEKAEQLEDLVELIQRQAKKKGDVYMKAQSYNALVGTKHEGNSGKLAAEYIQKFLTK